MKKNKQKIEVFDEAFDKGEASINFEQGIVTEGLSKIVKLPPITIPAWLALEIDMLSKLQANSRAAIIRQLLVEAIQKKRKSGNE
ncbi:MAG: hypothetical protein A2Z91_02235 [Deltaproteobacteria bacterium GWA2_38_16]|nr:MAG: hypothetical protein A2Z91_02235 [Deltaproteobacteria bacterium GWA2_38_16]OGQ02015.1 MAG: hypothetical protein A3D19_08530 [Deltaproteobacteria bacterium RIFCSPHIGHO2_02_FULL_38_15]OGQ33705.1 MAG: hypothetical protein A3A72_05790 [Deltaproteobacteria bacterium RIFCSPLOWO2_01_FULL_38_9]OGQ61065.1 MAG: hypothetical protein A3G92_02000 [Deltaproteobacteria bacterium RIFCSPLOWO2_12_FULL_38_8]HBQ21548.1 hypothetical protein [Deltaproteobacteria bacterium]